MTIKEVRKTIKALIAEEKTYCEILHILLHTNGVKLHQITKTLPKLFNA